MTPDDLLNIEITAHHQELASRLGLASIDGDHDRFCQVLGEIQSAGMPTALGIVAVINNHLASSLANTIGVPAARAVFQRTILDADGAGQ